MRQLILALGIALASLGETLRGRSLAFNALEVVTPAAATEATEVVTVGIPKGLDPEKVRIRKESLMKAGTEALLAEKLATDAEHQQMLRDKELTLDVKVEEVPSTKTVITVRARPDGEGPGEVDLNELTVPALVALASANELDLGGATRKADIIKAITSATKSIIAAICFALFFGATAPAAHAASVPTEVVSVHATPSQAATVRRITSAIPESPLLAIFAYLNFDSEDRMAAVVSLWALAFAACAWLPKQYRSRGAHLRYLADKWRELTASKFRRCILHIGLVCAAIAQALRGRSLATNTVFTPMETSRGTESMDADVAVGFFNAVVVRGSDDRHFKLTVDGSEIPLGILQQDAVDSGEAGVIKKSIALFGLYPESLPAVAAAAIAVDAELVVDIATPGRVKTLPVASGTYYVVGRSRFTVANAGDPVSIAHKVPVKIVVP